ncbi:MAG: hypothetical protein FGM18_10020 [Burkholderiaceae bacterium]|nr:hypothetical protein [Burkholderiaceae bacterium]
MIQFLKKFRDDLLLKRYVATVPRTFSRFLDQHAALEGSNLALVVAFEQPWILEIMLQKFRQNVSGFRVVVFDNSRNVESRDQIAQVCQQLSVPYFGLPPNLTKHPNRSHGRAMTWIYHNFVVRMRPDWFGFLDHDLIPVRPVDYGQRLQRYSCFGRRVHVQPPYWYMWAGYSFFRFASTASAEVNFLHDFPRNLDTGGRNWDPIYSKLKEDQILGVKVELVYAEMSGQENFSMSLMDAAWLHIGGVGHRSPDKRKAFYQALKAAFSLDDFVSERFCLRYSNDSTKVFQPADSRNEPSYR